MNIQAIGRKMVTTLPVPVKETDSGIIIPDNVKVEYQDVRNWICTVESVGEKVEGISIGDKVLLDPLSSPLPFKHTTGEQYLFLTQDQILGKWN
jgi:co-chaperonin GroES (HSP10)